MVSILSLKHFEFETFESRSNSLPSLFESRSNSLSSLFYFIICRVLCVELNPVCWLIRGDVNYCLF